MKNPCEDNCILRVVCTEVCDLKINYATLLKNALEQNARYQRSRTGRKILVGVTPTYRKWMRQLDDHAKDLINIENRKERKENQ